MSMWEKYSVLLFEVYEQELGAELSKSEDPI